MKMLAPCWPAAVQPSWNRRPVPSGRPGPEEFLPRRNFFPKDKITEEPIIGWTCLECLSILSKLLKKKMELPLGAAWWRRSQIRNEIEWFAVQRAPMQSTSIQHTHVGNVNEKWLTNERRQIIIETSAAWLPESCSFRRPRWPVASLREINTREPFVDPKKEDQHTHTHRKEKKFPIFFDRPILLPRAVSLAEGDRFRFGRRRI